jgi:hypothetical protein
VLAQAACANPALGRLPATDLPAANPRRTSIASLGIASAQRGARLQIFDRLRLPRATSVASASSRWTQK